MHLAVSLLAFVEPCGYRLCHQHLDLFEQLPLAVSGGASVCVDSFEVVGSAGLACVELFGDASMSLDVGV